MNKLCPQDIHFYFTRPYSLLASAGAALRMTTNNCLFLLILCLFWTCKANAIDQRYIDAVNNQKWDLAAKTADPDLHSLALWLKLINEKTNSFKELSFFIKRYPNWPKQDLLLQKIESSSFINMKPTTIQAWFKEYSPKSIEGKIRYLALIEDSKLKRQYVQQIWHQAVFNTAQEKEFLQKYQALLTPTDHLTRIDFFLHDRNLEQGIRMLPFLSNEERKIYNLRIKLIRGQVQLAHLDFNHQTNLGLLHDAAHKYDQNGDDDSLTKILLLASNIKHSSQVYLWRLKAKLIRDLIRKQNYQAAYDLTASHGHDDIKEYSEAEWLSGWIALRFLNAPKIAITHFSNLYNKVTMPISLSRGAYWLGRCYEKLGDQQKATYWHQISSQYYTSFYGQLSLCKINNCAVTLAKTPSFNKNEIAKYSANSLVKAAMALNQTRYSHLNKILLFQAINNSADPKEIAYITKINYGHDYHFSAELAKQAAYKNVIILEASYPMPKFIFAKPGIDKALVLSLIRQESVFNHQAISTAGAMGLMQIMPHVAKKTAANIKIAYHQAKLIQDPVFNTKLGVTHLDSLLRQYDNSYILSIAAYNAGGKPVSKWIEDNGDPRLMKTQEEIIDWIEKITFHETRNYVQRVLENRAIYHAILNNHLKVTLVF